MMSRCSSAVELARKAGPKLLERRRVERGDRAAPGLGILGQVLVAVPVAAPLGQPLVDHLEHGDARLLVLGQQPVEQGAGRRLLLGGEEPRRAGGAEPAEHDRTW